MPARRNGVAMRRPDLENRMAMECSEYGRRVLALGDADKEIDALKALLRDWLAACPEACGQCDDVRKRTEKVVR